MTSAEILALPMGKNDADAATVRDYLIRLLLDVWREQEYFNSKRPFGNSGWQYEIYKALGKAGVVEVVLDEDGFVDSMTDEAERAADQLIDRAIESLS